MSTQQSASVDDDTPFNKVLKATHDLYNIRDYYYSSNPDDKISKLHLHSNSCLQLLDSIPLELRKSAMQRATYEHLKGKILDVFPDYKKEAEDHLSKAVKLNPSLTDAWLCLGNCFWKKGDLVSAKNCFTRALTKGPEKNLLCQLSMLERKMAQGSENQAEIVEESIQHAKEAIALDVKDGNSWYNLGNACLTSFFVTGAWDHSKLSQSLKAYQNAEKDEKMKNNPDLYFNSATVNKYLENYEKSLSGFEAASIIDPGLKASDEVQKLVSLLDKLENALKGQTKAKRLASVASSLATVDVNPLYRKTTVDRLLEGLNKSIAVIGKVLFFVKHDDISPLYYVVCDPSQVCFVLSVYGIHDNVIKEGDQLSLLEPWYKSVEFCWKRKVSTPLPIRRKKKENLTSSNQSVSTSKSNYLLMANLFQQIKSHGHRLLPSTRPLDLPT